MLLNDCYLQILNPSRKVGDPLQIIFKKSCGFAFVKPWKFTLKKHTSSHQFPKSFGENKQTSKPQTDIFNGPTKILLGYGSRIDYYGPQVERCRLSFLTWTPEEETLFCSMHLLSYKLLVFVSFALEFVRNPNLLAEILAPCRFFRKISHLLSLYLHSSLPSPSIGYFMLVENLV